MQYFINFVRTPLPGKGPEVLAAVKASLDATGRPGGLTVPISCLLYTSQSPRDRG